MKNKHQEKIEAIAKSFSEIMVNLGLDLSDSSLKDTPKRVAKSLYNELCSATTGVYEFPSLTTFDNDKGYNQMVVVGEITFSSLCEHHFLPFIGTAHIAYIPKDKVLGLSKFSRVVDYFSKKPQVQERLTQEIADMLTKNLTNDVAVVLRAKHLCTCIRGIQDINSKTVTSYVGGAFEDPIVKQEFFKLIGM